MKVTLKSILLILFVILLSEAGLAAVPGEHMNYQGVLRDAAGNPLDGSYDVTLRLIDGEGGGLILWEEEHFSTGTGQVVVTGGLFNVALGTGVRNQNSSVPTLKDAFTYPEVWLEVRIGTEWLSPRTRVRGAGYALNAAQLDGWTADQFLNTSSTAQSKSGTLVVESPASGTFGVEGRGSTVDGFGGGGLFENMSGSATARVGDGDTGIIASGMDAGGYFADADSGTFTYVAMGSNGVNTNGALQATGSATVDSLRTTGIDSIFINQDGPDEDAMIYWYDEGSSQGAHLKWRNYFSQFEFSHSIRTPGYVRAFEFRADNLSDYHLKPGSLSTSAYLAGDVVIGQHMGDDDDYLYFDQQAAYLRWREANARFEFNSSLAITGSLQSDSGLNLTHPDLYLNQDGPDADSSIYFHEGTPTGARMFWNNADSMFQLSHPLRVPGAIRATSFHDNDNIAYFVDPGAATSGVLEGDLVIGHGSASDNDAIQFDQQAESMLWNNSKTRFEISDDLAINGPLQTGATGLAVVAYNRLGAGVRVWADIQSSDDLYVSDDIEVGGELALSKVIRMEAQETAGGDGDQAIYFYDGGSPTNSYIQWDDVSAITCGTIGNINSGFRWNITDNTDSGWVFGNGSDYEAVIDELGNLEIDGSLHQSGSCDLAETFFGPSGLTAGTVVVLDPDRSEGVRESYRPYDGGVAGVVTTRPGVLLSGPSADAYPVWEELEEVGERLAALPPDAVDTLGEGDDEIVSLDTEAVALQEQRRSLEQRASELEMELDSWARGDVAVALVGRVPVKADASYGPIRKGDYLTTSATPGYAQVLDVPGPYLGIAMDDLPSGQGRVLVFLSKGWYGGAVATEGESVVDEPAAVIAEVQTMEAGLELVLDRDADDRSRFSIHKDGGNGLSSEVFRVDEQGNVFATGSFRPAAMDVAEFHPVSEPVGVGDVLVVDRERPGHMALGRLAADPAVTGIVSTEPGILLGSGVRRIAEADPELAAALEIARTAGDSAEEARLWAELEGRFSRTHAAIALSGTVPCKVDAGFGAIEVGDLLTVSPTAGHAMRAADPAPQGTVIGKALEPLDAGTGTIRVLVMMR